MISKILSSISEWRKPKWGVPKVFEVNGVKMKICEHTGSWTADSVATDLKNDSYQLSKITFEKGDIVLDIGGHVGMVSIYLAKKYPFLKIYAYEPIPFNYERFVHNIKLNRVKNIQVFNLAVTKDGRDLDMILGMHNTGGATGQLQDMHLPGHHTFTVHSTTLDRIFETHQITACKFMKIDCEGSEHEILMNTKYLNRVQYLSGEFHINSHLRRKGYSIELLYQRCTEFLPPERVVYVSCNMAE